LNGALVSIKVAHVTTIDLSLRYLLLNQLHAIQQAGYEVVGISSPGPEVPVIEAAGIRHVAVPMTRRITPLADIISCWRLYQVLRRERCTIVHTHNAKPGLFGQHISRLAGVPVVVHTLHGFYLPDRMHPAWRWFYFVLEKLASRSSDAILSQNNEDIELAVNERICSREKISYLGNGIDIQRFDRNQLDESALSQKRHELGLSPDAPVVGFVGRLVEEKGILELLQAIQTVLQHLPSVRVLIIGPIDHHKPDALTSEIAYAYGLGDTCLFTGMRHDMPELYALMDVFVLPSHREGYPRAPMEASAMGVPCIVTNIRGCRETVIHERNGLLVPLRDVQALSQAIITLMTDPEKKRRMGAEGRCLALERFDERTVFERVKMQYARLLREKGLPVPEPLPGKVEVVS